MHLLDAPAAVHELHGQPVQQFGMRRGVTHLAEVVQRADDAAAKVVVPDAIDDHSRCERIVARGDPLRQRQSTTRGAPIWASQGCRWIAVGGNGQKPR